MAGKMRHCKYCGAEIAKTSGICPQCGAKYKKPIYKRFWFWLLIIVIIFFVIFFGPDDVPDTTNSGKNINTANESITPLNVGESAKIGDLELTVTGWKFSNRRADNAYESVAESNKIYCVVYLKAKNTGNQNITLAKGITYPNYETSLVFSKEYKYLCSFRDNNLYFNAKMSLVPLEEYIGTINYQVPKEVSERNDESLVFNFSWGKNNLSWELRSAKTTGN